MPVFLQKKKYLHIYFNESFKHFAMKSSVTALGDTKDFRMSLYLITKYWKEFYHLKVLFLSKQSANGTHGRLNGMCCDTWRQTFFKKM